MKGITILRYCTAMVPNLIRDMTENQTSEFDSVL